MWILIIYVIETCNIIFTVIVCNAIIRLDEKSTKKSIYIRDILYQGHFINFKVNNTFLNNIISYFLLVYYSYFFLIFLLLLFFVLCVFLFLTKRFENMNTTIKIILIFFIYIFFYIFIYIIYFVFNNSIALIFSSQ